MREVNDQWRRSRIGCEVTCVTSEKGRSCIEPQIDEATLDWFWKETTSVHQGQEEKPHLTSDSTCIYHMY
jgi:hypothetical protein